MHVCMYVYVYVHVYVYEMHGCKGLCGDIERAPVSSVSYMNE
jgi:hypothetical protein